MITNVIFNGCILELYNGATLIKTMKLNTLTYTINEVGSFILNDGNTQSTITSCYLGLATFKTDIDTAINTCLSQGVTPPGVSIVDGEWGVDDANNTPVWLTINSAGTTLYFTSANGSLYTPVGNIIPLGTDNQYAGGEYVGKLNTATPNVIINPPVFYDSFNVESHSTSMELMIKLLMRDGSLQYFTCEKTLNITYKSADIDSIQVFGHLPNTEYGLVSTFTPLTTFSEDLIFKIRYINS